MVNFGANVSDPKATVYNTYNYISGFVRRNYRCSLIRITDLRIAGGDINYSIL